MKPLPSLILALCLSACGGVDGGAIPAPQSGGGASGASGGGTSGGTSGGGIGGGTSGGAMGSGTGGTAGASSGCPAMAFSQAPLPCSQDWAHAKLAYTLPCTDPNAKGYLAACAPYDAVIAKDASSESHCFYAKQTGNLVGAMSQKGTAATACMSFDLDFTAPDPSACTPVAGGTCPP